MKKVLCCIQILLLCSCSSTKILHDRAKVEAVEKIQEADKGPSTGTVVGASTGAGTGMLIGGLAGTGACVGIALATFGLGAPVCVATIGGGLVGGMLIGGAVGGTTGYIYDRHAAGSGIYQYSVIVEQTGKTLTVVQSETDPIPVGQIVKVTLEKSGQLRIALLKEKT